MESMNRSYGRDLDLNLLRAFVAVADAGGVTAAASRLYLTQPAVSAALRRLTAAVGAPLFARQGRRLGLTARGERLLAAARPHLEALVDAALSPPAFDPATSERTFRLGLSDASESWLLPALLGALEEEAPRMRFIAVPVQFRTVGDALAERRVDAAVTVADDLPAGCARKTLFVGGFVCLFDPRRARRRRLTLEDYFARDHVIVSYNGDLRGIVEDMTGRRRRVRCSVSSFQTIGAIVDGTALVATVPAMTAREITRARPHLATAPLPFPLPGAPMELLWQKALDDDDAFRFLRDHIVRIARQAARRDAGA
jgi:LysR family transcriptional activator of mexEF-oprN operon